MIYPEDIHVLVACEESQAVTLAFRERGFTAFSCDIQPCGGHHPEFHIQGDVTPYIKGTSSFYTQDGTYYHFVDGWHLVIAHPPCTYLCKVSSVQLVHNGVVDPQRHRKMEQGREFFFRCLSARAPFVAVENPLPMARARLPRPTTYIHPSDYGHKYTKKTLLWLKNLPPLMATIDYPGAKSFVNASRGKYRSRTFSGVAQAMADQWGDYILDELNRQHNK